MRRTLWVIVLALCLPAAAAAQGSAEPGSTPNTLKLKEGAPRAPAKVADLAWLAGRWTGEGLGGRVEEAWSEPDAGSMVGYFRLVKDGKPVFYEIMTLFEAEGSVEMRLKHVNPDMTGWEEKNGYITFKLVKHDETGAYFSGLTFRRVSADQIDGYLALRNRADNTIREEKFTYRRVR